MIDFDRLRRALVLGALGAAAMALLLPALSALRYTDAHDWYAARKVSVAEALMFVGFDEHAATDYRLADGRAVRWLRDGVATYPPARESRHLILTVIGDNAVLGACAGFAVLFALSGLLNLARHEAAGVPRVSAQRSRSPAAGRRPGFIEDLPPYAMDRPDRAPAGATSVAPVAPEGSPRPSVAGRRAPPAKAEPQPLRAPPARPRGRWF